jgi:hypothetical protein
MGHEMLANDCYYVVMFGDCEFVAEIEEVVVVMKGNGS